MVSWIVMILLVLAGIYFGVLLVGGMFLFLAGLIDVLVVLILVGLIFGVVGLFIILWS